MAKAYYHSLPTVLCKILGVYTVRFHNKESGKKVVENVVVMENIFYQVSGAITRLLLFSRVTLNALSATSPARST